MNVYRIKADFPGDRETTGEQPEHTTKARELAFLEEVTAIYVPKLDPEKCS